MVGDPNQNIYQFNGGKSDYLLNFKGQSFSLINNYRTMSTK